MVDDDPNSPGALNRDLRQWVKNWTGKGIGQIGSTTNISRSRLYAATDNSTLVPRDVLLDIIRAVVPATYDTEDRTAWILRWTREWERRWEVVEAATRGEKLQPTSPIPSIAPAPLPPIPADHFSRLPSELAHPALRQVTDDAVRAIAANHVYVAHERRAVGHRETAASGVYIDLHSASCHSRDRENLAQFLAQRLWNALGRLDPAHTVIATPREGNILVGSRVAELCGVPFLMVRTKRAPRFGFPVEGPDDPGTRAVLVDDVVMGSLIPRTAKLLREYTDMQVTHCFSIFERSDVEARELLERAQLSLDAAYEIDDDLLFNLRHLFDARGSGD